MKLIKMAGAIIGSFVLVIMFIVGAVRLGVYLIETGHTYFALAELCVLIVFMLFLPSSEPTSAEQAIIDLDLEIAANLAANPPKRFVKNPKIYG
jgi:hypothetical protein